jgi:uncharacterized protein (TIGR02186 family)
MRVLISALVVATLGLGTAATADGAKENVEADASTRQVAITSSFTGTEILVFGTVENSVQPSAASGTYDVVVVVEGEPAPVIVRKKARVGGLWINTSSMQFAAIPSFYAIASTRPVDAFADGAMLDANGIGFKHVQMVHIGSGRSNAMDPVELANFKEAVIRLKEREQLFVQSDSGVSFIGRSLFRATIALPPNVPVGPLITRVYLFKEGRILGQYTSHVTLERQGIERYIHDAALTQPLFYGLATVLLGMTAGLTAAFAFSRRV